MGAETRAAGDVTVSGRTLSGVAMRYGDVAMTPAGLERFEPGAFGDVAAADAILTFQHDANRPLARTGGAGLVLSDSREALRYRAVLPETRAASDTLALVRAGVLRGASVRFVPVAERHETGVRVIERAALLDLGIVDVPAYPASTVEARQQLPVAVSGDVNLGRSLSCRCRDGCETIRLEPGAFDRALAEVEAGTREITAFVTGNFGTPVASTGSGPGTARPRSAMRITATDTALSVAIPSLFAVTAVADLLAVAAGSFVAFRPYFPDDTSEAEKVGSEWVVSEADLRAIEIAVITGPTEGLERVEIADERPPGGRRGGPVRRRVYL